MDRKYVYEVVDDERNHQNYFKDPKLKPETRTVGEEIALLECYVRKALNAWADNPGDNTALHEIRKIAAIAVRCMEQHGAPRRP